ncbi:putative membrane protein YhhN [Ruminiclostridium sufflavum DSM 19573]|uniref:Putative membrane protein YhhN n=1 Tax=Ruminiclostridium sufflavum DSM 19573 TaxID=1121337 RepID=A0A318XU78_9FIRM|nr:lysoplasmalogenase [Ruminiclostridium sufflavum]PYG90190.1 putative membrane protein YhhN [Ruminiclostridium sufflavum DSM 19573]
MYIILFILMLISTNVLIIVNGIGIMPATIIFKCLSSILFIAVARCSYKRNPSNTKFFALMLAGLIFSSGGDMFLAFDKNNGIFFVAGVASFSIAHIMYSLGYCSMTGFSLKDILIFSGFFIPTCFIVVFGNFEFNGLKLLVVFYSAIISFMVSKAVSMLKYYSDSKKAVSLMVSGSVLFFISDWVLLFLFFYPNAASSLQAVNWMLYYTGQGLLGLSFSCTLEKDMQVILPEKDNNGKIFI